MRVIVRRKYFRQIKVAWSLFRQGYFHAGVNLFLIANGLKQDEKSVGKAFRN